jgi:hypothetical protein
MCDIEEAQSRYTGPFVTIRPEGQDYIVAIQPVLPSGEGEPRAFGSKNEAWWQVLTFARAHRLPVRDLTVSETARAHRK